MFDQPLDPYAAKANALLELFVVTMRTIVGYVGYPDKITSLENLGHIPIPAVALSPARQLAENGISSS